jgi:hypothetical protein
MLHLSGGLEIKQNLIIAIALNKSPFHLLVIDHKTS